MAAESTSASSANGPGSLAFGPFRFDPEDRTLSSAAGEIPLPPRAGETLAHLLENRGKVVAKEELLEAVWPGVFVSDSALKEAVFLIRKALGDDPQKPTYIQTVHRRGYRWVAPVAAAPGEPRPAPPDANRPSPVDGAADRKLAKPPLIFGACAVGLAIAGLAVMAWLAPDRDPTPPLAVTRVALDVGAPHELRTAGLAISSDGRKLVYVAKDQDLQLFLRRMDELEPTVIDGTVGARRPFFSPDDRWLGFFARGKLQVVPAAGGAARILADAPLALGADWGPDGTIVFAGEEQGGLRRVAAEGGAVEELTRPGSVGESHRWPEILPGGEAILYTVWRGRLDDARIALLDLASGESTILVEGGSAPRFVPPGTLLYSRPNQLMAVPWDGSSGAVDGSPVPVLSGLDTNFSQGGAEVAISGDGTLAYIREQLPIPERVLEWTDFEDRRHAIPVAPGRYFDVALAADGRRAAVTVSQGQGSDVWILDLETGERQRLTHGNTSGLVVWPPGSEDVIYLSRAGGRSTILSQRADGASEAETLLACEAMCVPRGVDGKGRLIYLAPASGLAGLSLRAAVAGSSSGRLVLDPPERVRDVALSPGGRWLAYETEAAGTWEIFVRPYGAPGGKWQISIGGGSSPQWSSDGRWLYYQARDQLIAVAVQSGDVFRAAGREPRLALDGVLAWKLAPDGERLLLVKAAPGASRARIDVVFGWSAELRRILASG